MRVRFLGILISLVLGLASGLVYGWVIQPVRYVDAAPGSLRLDYRTDYVLMVAEVFLSDDDIEMAQVRLAALGPLPATDILEQALVYAQENGFSVADLQTLNYLARELQAIPPTPEIGGP
ncbi:MAG: hypothetical protein PVJ32_01045 [Anaerolineales bacterium]